MARSTVWLRRLAHVEEARHERGGMEVGEAWRPLSLGWHRRGDGPAGGGRAWAGARRERRLAPLRARSGELTRRELRGPLDERGGLDLEGVDLPIADR